jgi:type III pantothenate kinase
MLLAIDVGNTHTVVGCFHGEQLKADWRIATDRQRTEDEYGTLLLQLLRNSSLDPRDIRGVAIACVVPPALEIFTAVCRKFFSCEPLVASSQNRSGLRVLYNPPHAVGADRIANAVAAKHKYRLPAIIVDLGTAITFDVISGEAEYLGGAITPGIHISLDALSARAAKLPRIELRKPDKAIGTTTEESMQSGVVFGAIGTVDALVTRIKAELAGEAIVIATGGLAKAIARESANVDVVDEQLTLDGLRLLYDLNAKPSSDG